MDRMETINNTWYWSLFKRPCSRLIAARIRENSPICANLIPTIKEILMGARKRMQERNVRNIFNKITPATSPMKNKTESKNTSTCKSIPTEIKNILLK